MGRGQQPWLQELSSAMPPKWIFRRSSKFITPPSPPAFRPRNWNRSQWRAAANGFTRTLRRNIRFGWPNWTAQSPVGSSFREFLPRCAYRGTVEISVYVSKQLQRRGVARKLLAEAVARGRQLGMHSLVGLIFSNNEPSIALFRAAGFERWGLLPAVARLDETPCDLTIFGRHV